MGDVTRGLKFGAGFAISWALVFVIVPVVLFMGGCAVLLAVGSSAGDSHRSAQPFTTRDERVLAGRATANVRDYFAHVTPTAASCRFVRRDRVGPDSWLYACRVTASTARGRRVYVQGVECFDPPHYASFDAGSCTLSGDPKRAA